MQKIHVQKLLEEQSDEFEVDDFVETLYLLGKIEKAEADIAAGRVFTHEEVEKIVDQWHDGTLSSADVT